MNNGIEHCDVVVLGCGGMGAAACRHLAARGAKVVGLERFERLHEQGSSHGNSRVVRQAYFEHPNYVPLLTRSFKLWDELEEQSGLPCLFRVGALFAGPPESEVYRGSLESAQEHNVKIEDLSPEALRERFPQFDFDPGTVAVLEPGAGLVVPENGIMGHLLLAERDGADIRENVEVEAVESTETGIVVRTSSGSLCADRLVITAGAWTSRFVQFPGMPLEVHRKVLCWFEPLDPDACDATRMPVWIVDEFRGVTDGDYYGIPTWSGQSGPPGVKVGFHGLGTIVDPDIPDRKASDDVIAQFQQDLQQLLPGVLGRVTHSTTCLYTVTPDGNFIIDRLPKDERIIVACGFSGHGYKFAPVVGEILAGLALDGRTEHPIEFLRILEERT